MECSETEAKSAPRSAETPPMTRASHPHHSSYIARCDTTVYESVDPHQGQRGGEERRRVGRARSSARWAAIRLCGRARCPSSARTRRGPRRTPTSRWARRADRRTRRGSRRSPTSENSPANASMMKTVLPSPKARKRKAALRTPSRPPLPSSIMKNEVIVMDSQPTRKVIRRR